MIKYKEHILIYRFKTRPANRQNVTKLDPNKQKLPFRLSCQNLICFLIYLFFSQTLIVYIAWKSAFPIRVIVKEDISRIYRFYASPQSHHIIYNCFIKHTHRQTTVAKKEKKGGGVVSGVSYKRLNMTFKVQIRRLPHPNTLLSNHTHWSAYSMRKF